MTHGSLFSGIGGFDLAAEWMGWENKFHCEWNEFGQRVLNYYWPNAELFTDITKSDFKKYANTIDVLTGGFPCQPYSSAGKRLGKEDIRHLWPEMLRVIREVAPRYVVGENVRGLITWNGGMVFDEVCADLEALGYQVAPFIIPASAVNAPHQRERVWFVAYSDRFGNRGTSELTSIAYKQGGRSEAHSRERDERKLEPIRDPSSSGNATDSDSNGLDQRDGEHEKHPSETGFDAFDDIKQITMHTNGTSKQGEHIRQTREGKFNGSDSRNGFDNFKNFPTQSPICSGNDGFSSELDGITFSKWRNESIKAYGNAIVPQVVYQIFKAIEEYESKRQSMATVLELF